MKTIAAARFRTSAPVVHVVHVAPPAAVRVVALIYRGPDRPSFDAVVPMDCRKRCGPMPHTKGWPDPING
ncbi:hypothetical protein FHT00_002400 [Sphingomonas insulae]|uniref:hypothetical protein n=1 Tax=Sphingomonas insulae TaxID=424800 RepID=UPI0013D1B7E1|nr:hypothetical protein [Sphingomonas insulae]NIJ30437.1 hypothetical protein [Sphingomonas insulae]